MRQVSVAATSGHDVERALVRWEREVVEVLLPPVPTGSETETRPEPSSPRTS